MPGLQTNVTSPSLDVAVADDADRVICSLVGRLRERRPGGVRGVLESLFTERDQALDGKLSAEASTILKKYETLMLTALSTRYDALDSALVETSFAVAEIDGEGVISYANDALLELVPEAVGKPFAPLFGLRGDDVRKAVESEERETLWLDLTRDNHPRIHLRGEIGPLRDELGRSGAYALLLSLTDEEARLESAPYGILRVDVGGIVAFANREAEKLFGRPRSELVGLAADSLFRRTEEAGESASPEPWQSLVAREITTDALRRDGSDSVPVRVAVLPSLEEKTGMYAGALLAVRPRAKELATAEINRLLTDASMESEDLVRGVMAAIRPILPFDFATFSLLAQDMKHSLTGVVFPEPKKWQWTTAWFPLGPNVARFLRSENTWGRDLPAAIRDLAPEARHDKVVVNLVENEHMVEFLTLPLQGDKGVACATLTLMSRKFANNADAYGARHLELLRELRVDAALLVAEASITRRRTERMLRLSERLTAAAAYHDLANALAEGIAGCFGWDYVGVYGIDRRSERFLLISQHAPRGAAVALKENEQRKLSDGVLGRALRDGAAINVPHVAADPEYRPALPTARSAWARPLRVAKRPHLPDGNQIEWLVSIESRLDNAFEGPDMVVLRQVVEQCENILSGRWQRAIQEALLGNAEQALVVVDRTGVIQLTNSQAQQLLCRSGDILVGTSLDSLGTTEADCWLLRSAVEISKRKVTLISAEGQRAALATQRLINDDYEHRLWLFTDLSVVPRRAEGQYLEQTVTEVAQTTRLPLLLAGSLLRGAVAKLLNNRATKDLLEKAISQIGKADITYERLANALSVRQEPDQPRHAFDAVAVLERAIDALPEDDRDRCRIKGVKAPATPKRFLVAGWPEQLHFAFRSLLGFMLQHRKPRANVSIELRRRDEDGSSDMLEIVMSTMVGNASAFSVPAGASDLVSMRERQAWERAGLAPEAVQLALGRHGGSFASARSGRGKLVFSVTLAAAAHRVTGQRREA